MAMVDELGNGEWQAWQWWAVATDETFGKLGHGGGQWWMESLATVCGSGTAWGTAVAVPSVSSAGLFRVRVQP